MWYDGNQTLTYNCLFNFIVGNRGCGKTYWSKRWAINDFLKNGNQFVYVRRYETEIKGKIKTFFADISNEFPDHKFEVKGKDFYIDGKLSGYTMVLSKAKIQKSVSFPNVTKIIFDEFIIEKGVYRYLTNEVETFLDLYETIARTRDNVIVFFLSNAITFTNPYFLYFDIKYPKNQKGIYRNGDILMQLVADDDFINMKKQTRFGRLIDGTKYGEYSIENKFMLDNDTFIAKKTDKARYYFTVIYQSHSYAVWVDFQEGMLFCNEQVDSTFPIVYTVTMKDHKPNTLLLQKSLKTGYLKIFIENYKMGNVYFSNMKIKNVFYEIIKMCLNVA